MSRYAIWNKQDQILTPSGKVFTAEEWKEKFPIASLANITVVCGGGEINGSFFGTLGQMKELYGAQGCDFTGCETGQAVLEAIEAFENAKNAPREGVSNEELTATSLASIAASMEYQNLLTLDDVQGA